MTERGHLTRYAWLSIVAAVATIALKASAFLMTGSVGLLSDALESSVNLVAAVLALIVLAIAAQPPDEEHAYGHAKAEYFASGVEGTLIIIAAITIAVSAIQRLVEPVPLHRLGFGILVSVLAALINLQVAVILRKAGTVHRSITLEADAVHLMTDVWTTAGVVLGVGAVVFTGQQILDPLIAIAVTGQIVLSGIRLLRRSVQGLMDVALPTEEIDTILKILEEYSRKGIQYHALRTRQSGAQRFVSVHVQVPGEWSVQIGHSLLEELEHDIRYAFDSVTVFTHLEPIEDPVSWEDISIFRPADKSDLEDVG